MNEETNAPVNPGIPLISHASPTLHNRPFSYWAKKFLACNPFYLVSAMLLLYGLYSVSKDPHFLTKELSQLSFNYSSLQVYELFLVATAMFLARYGIRYDSHLLGVLENMLLLVPFILISQAALNEISITAVWVLSTMGACMVVARAFALQRSMPDFRLTPGNGFVGLAVLAANTLLPIIYRTLHEHKIGTQLAAGPAYYFNEYTWSLLLPLLCGMALFIPGSRSDSAENRPLPWLSLGLFALWFGGTSVHLYCLSYVYDFNLRPQLLAPVLWVMGWVIWMRRGDWFLAAPGLKFLLFIPWVAGLLAFSASGNITFVVLMVLSCALYSRVYVRDRTQLLSLHLCFLALVSAIGGFPITWINQFVPEIGRGDCLGFAAALYLVGWAKLSRDPKVGVLGGFLALVGVLVIWHDKPDCGNWAVQAALGFLLMHSFRWVDAAQNGTSKLRAFAAFVWVAHALYWMSHGWAWLPFLVAVLLFGGCLIARLADRRWEHVLLMVGTLLVMLYGPLKMFSDKLHEFSNGVLAVAASFLLLFLGTALALIKHRWHKRLV